MAISMTFVILIDPWRPEFDLWRSVINIYLTFWKIRGGLGGKDGYSKKAV